MIKRRRFLTGLAVAGGVAAVLGWRVSRATREQAIEAMIYKRLSYLKLDRDGVRQFARDFASKENISSSKLRLIAAFVPVYERLSTSPDQLIGHALRFGEERVTGRYLLSSDFFANDADESRIVRYTGFFDPLRACGNPFARPVLQQQTAASSS